VRTLQPKRALGPLAALGRTSGETSSPRIWASPHPSPGGGGLPGHPCLMGPGDAPLGLCRERRASLGALPTRPASPRTRCTAGMHLPQVPGWDLPRPLGGPQAPGDTSTGGACAQYPVHGSCSSGTVYGTGKGTGGAIEWGERGRAGTLEGGSWGSLRRKVECRG